MAVEDPVRTSQWRRMARERSRQLLRSRHAVRWFRILVRAVFASVLGFGAVAAAWSIVTPDSDTTEMGKSWLTGGALFGTVVAAVAAVYFSRTLKAVKSAQPHAPRKRWRGLSINEGAGLALGVGLSLFWLEATLVNLLLAVIDLPSTGPWSLLLPIAGAAWAFVARYNLELELLATAAPPELSLAFDLRERVKAFQTGADAFELAMHEAWGAVEKMQQAITSREQRLSEVHEDYQRYLRQSEQARQEAEALSKLTKEELIERLGLYSHFLEHQQAKERRRSLRREIAFFASGALVSAILNTDAVKDSIERLFPW